MTLNQMRIKSEEQMYQTKAPLSSPSLNLITSNFNGVKRIKSARCPEEMNKKHDGPSRSIHDALNASGENGLERLGHLAFLNRKQEKTKISTKKKPTNVQAMLSMCSCYKSMNCLDISPNRKELLSLLTSICSCLESTNGPSCRREVSVSTRKNTAQRMKCCTIRQTSGRSLVMTLMRSSKGSKVRLSEGVYGPQATRTFSGSATAGERRADAVKPDATK